YELNDWIGVFGQASFVRTQVHTRNLVAPAITSWSVLIPHGDDIFLGDYTLNNSPGPDGRYRTADDIPTTGAVNLGIPSSILANGNTHPDYLPGGPSGLTSRPSAGVTNSWSTRPPRISGGF